jgi:hypothetical protein
VLAMTIEDMISRISGANSFGFLNENSAYISRVYRRVSQTFKCGFS